MSLPVAIAGAVVTAAVAVVYAARAAHARHEPAAPLIGWADPDNKGGYVVGA